MKKLIFVTILCTFVWLGLVGCNDDCPTCPKEEPTKHWRAFVTMASESTNFQVIDLENDSLVFSEVYGATGGPMTSTSDGSFVVAAVLGYSTRAYRIYDTKGPTEVNSVPIVGGPMFLRGDSLVLRIRADSLYIDRFPSWQTKVSIPTSPQIWQRFLDHARNRLYFTLQEDDTLRVLDIDSLAIVDKWFVGAPGADYFLRRFVVNHEGTTAYFLAQGPTGGSFLVYDLQERRIVADRPIYAPFGDLRLHPNGREVYVLDPGFPDSPFIPQEILVFDSVDGRWLYGISLVGLNPLEPNQSLTAWTLEFTPDGNTLLVGTGHYKMTGGSLLRVNTITKRVERVYNPLFNQVINDIEIVEIP